MDVDDIGWPAPAGLAQPEAAPEGGIPTPRSPADRVAAAERILGIRPHWSDRAIAAASGLASGTVAAIRARAGITQAQTRIGRDGRVRPVSAAAGRRAAGCFLSLNPNASLRDIARVAGISVSTARDVRERVRRGEDPVPPKQRSAGRGEPPGPPRSVEDLSPPRSWTALAVLRNDPALRGVLRGRMLLHLINQHAVVFGDWRGLADMVPQHCAGLVSATARECARAWWRFADHVDRRQRDGDQRA